MSVHQLPLQNSLKRSQRLRRFPPTRQSDNQRYHRKGSGFHSGHRQDVQQELIVDIRNMPKTLRVEHQIGVLSCSYASHATPYSPRWPSGHTKTCSRYHFTGWRWECRGIGFGRDTHCCIIQGEKLWGPHMQWNHVKHAKSNSQCLWYWHWTEPGLHFLPSIHMARPHPPHPKHVSHVCLEQ